MNQQFSYPDVLAASQRANWRIEDLINADKRLDFNKPFMPETLARTAAMKFLDAEERMILNQIRGHGYLYIFGMVEEFILPFVMDHARQRLDGDDARTRAFLGFAAEEAKHIDLFKRFRREFTQGFGTECQVIGPPEEIARLVLAHHPLAVALVILHIEWMTQRHYLDSIKDDQGLDPMFKSLLKHHWMEEAQHAKLDTLMVEALAATCSKEGIADAIEEYFQIGGLLDGGLKQQVLFDMEALDRATGRKLAGDGVNKFVDHQHQAQRWTFLGSGMSHPNFLGTVEKISPAARQRIEEASALFS
jgi:hypothetical protein